MARTARNLTRRRRISATPLFAAQHGERHCNEHRLCVECGEDLVGRQQRWCSQACVDAYLVRKNGREARRAVYARDKGRCAICGTATDEIREVVKRADARADDEWRRWTLEHRGYSPKSFKRYGAAIRRRPGPNTRDDFRRRHRLIVLGLMGLGAWWMRKTWWDMDHVVPVARGGGGCGLDNLQTLCLPCHRDKTTRQARARSQRSRVIPRLPREVCHGEPPCRLGDRDLCGACERYQRRVRG